jgi:phosphonate transport system substrate-binding protein
LEPQLIEKIKSAFLSLDYGKPEHKKILDLQRTHKFIPTQAENYRSIEEAAKSAGLIKD